MPLYEYECRSCGRRFEQIQKFSDPLVSVCPHCGASDVQKLLSTPAIQFKGSGWYITDYARKGSGESAEKSGGGDAKDKDAASKKDSNPASTSEAGASSASSDSAPAAPAKASAKE